MVGVDGLIDHWPWPRTQVGFNYERRIGGPWDSDGEDTAIRAVVYGRYIFQLRSSSLYLPPMHYLEAFATYSGQLPAVRPDADARCGAAGLDAAQRPALPAEPVHAVLGPGVRGLGRLVAAGGVADFAGETRGIGQLRGELAAVRKLPDWLGYLSDVRRPAGSWRWAAVPDEGQFFALGGGTLFRGFDLAERQGSFLWVANAELRLPLVRDVRWDCSTTWSAARNAVRGRVLRRGRDVRERPQRGRGGARARGGPAGGRGSSASSSGRRCGSTWARRSTPRPRSSSGSACSTRSDPGRRRFVDSPVRRNGGQRRLAIRSSTMFSGESRRAASHQFDKQGRVE